MLDFAHRIIWQLKQKEITMKLEYPSGATPLNPDESAGLIPLHISTQNQLNEWESKNILDAENWLYSILKRKDNYLASEFVKLLHKKMFEKPWKWAGTFRKSDKNIGVDNQNISVELKKLLDDTIFQIRNQSY